MSCWDAPFVRGFALARADATATNPDLHAAWVKLAASCWGGELLADMVPTMRTGDPVQLQMYHDLAKFV